ncbi:MAG: alpha/beta fold hydrolase [Kiritimatiellia bacterium]|nr:alpha/beta fold hydrolase [Kiritimatiellia bacterium]MDP6847146.1 alpha/beta fold hydrolase [Kiritimatiellia bacterium]
METPASFNSESGVLRGVLHSPADAPSQPRAGIIFLHGWSGCRLGPHRMFVKLARQLCEKGHHCLRFDFGGRGESDGDTDSASINSMVADTNKALEFMSQASGADHTVLLGICSGSKVAVGAATTATGIRGLVLMSQEPMGNLRRGPETDRQKSATALRTYLAKLSHPETWRKILTLRVNTGMVGKAVFGHESPDEAELRTETGWLESFGQYQGRILFVYGSNDPAAKVARGKYQDYCSESGLDSRFYEVADANHSFYSLDWEREVMDVVEDWLAQEE